MSFNTTTSSWLIDVAFSIPSGRTIPAFFLPRVQKGPTGQYTPAFAATFRPAAFPCSTADTAAKAATTCCVADFLSSYHVVESLSAPPADSCQGPYSRPPALNASAAVFGLFGDDMPDSSVAPLPTPPGMAAGTWAARVSIGDADLRLAASMLTVQEGGAMSMASFLGLAKLTPMPGSRILASSVAQVPPPPWARPGPGRGVFLSGRLRARQIGLSLTRAEYFTVSSSGAVDSTFLTYIVVQANEVRETVLKSLRTHMYTHSKTERERERERGRERERD